MLFIRDHAGQLYSQVVNTRRYFELATAIPLGNSSVHLRRFLALQQNRCAEHRLVELVAIAGHYKVMEDLPAELRGKVIQLPKREDVSVEIQEQLIIELCSK